MLEQEKSAILLNNLCRLSDDTKVKDDSELKALFSKYIANLKVKTDYYQVVTSLSRSISKYYLRHRMIPKDVLTLYHTIYADVEEYQANDKSLRNQTIATGLMSVPIIF